VRSGRGLARDPMRQRSRATDESDAVAAPDIEPGRGGNPLLVQRAGVYTRKRGNKDLLSLYGAVTQRAGAAARHVHPRAE
jgi:hypothetical protein